MHKVLLFSALLLLGLFGSQVLPNVVPDYSAIAFAVRLLTMVGLAFIMIHVGYEFEIDKRNPGQYGWDYLVAATAAAFPWVFCCLYFVFVMIPPEGWSSSAIWKETLLASRFAAPTSAGVLFSMLAAAGLGATWLFKKARILAIFDDLDTVLLLIPLQIMMVGYRWQLLAVVFVLFALLWAAWRFLHKVSWPITWKWVLGYACGLVVITELVYISSKLLDPAVPVHLEVLLPAFVLGCVLARPHGEDPHRHDAIEGHLAGPETPEEQKAAAIVSGGFMFLVGMSMPVFLGPRAHSAGSGALVAITPAMGWSLTFVHVLAITVLSNLGKMFVSLFYRGEAGWRERIALGIGLWPRGEVGAGVLVLSLGYGIGGPVAIVAMLSLALNLMLTGVVIAMIKPLIAGIPEGARRRQPTVAQYPGPHAGTRRRAPYPR